MRKLKSAAHLGPVEVVNPLRVAQSGKDRQGQLRKSRRHAVRRTLMTASIVLSLLMGGAMVSAQALSSMLALRSSSRAGQDSNSPKKVACEDAVKNAPKIKAGMKETEVLELLGSPTARSGDQWSYDFQPCAKPPQVGEQVITGLDVFFHQGVVSRVRFGWIDATGPPPARTKPKQDPPRKETE